MNAQQPFSLRNGHATRAPWTWLFVAILPFVVVTNVSAGPPEPRPSNTTVRLGSSRSIIALRPNPKASQSRSTSQTTVNDFPRPPVVGFSPLVAITTSDERVEPFEEDYEHDIQENYVGSSLTGLINPPFVIGYLDSGADVDLTAGSAAETLGIVGPYLTENTVQLFGVGGELVDAIVTQPIGLFAAGLSSVLPNGALDINAVVGHTNVSLVVAPPIDCGGQEIVNAVAGVPFVTFFNSLIRVDTPHTILHNGRIYKGPDVELLSQFAPPPSEVLWLHRVSMEFGGAAPAVTAGYYPDIFNLEDQETPWIPTRMSAIPGFLPTGGAFFATLFVSKETPSPSNPVQEMRVLVDTGAQSSIMSEGMVSNLSLPFEPDFEVDVCGVGGTTFGVPGYYLGYVKLNASGEALEFSNAPFVVMDLPSPEGGVLDGILGMNFFWNRNVFFDPALTESAFIWLSEPVDFAYGDFDRDLDVDDDDASTLLYCFSGPESSTLSPECYHLDLEEDGDLDMADYAAFQRCYRGADVPADPHCPP